MDKEINPFRNVLIELVVGFIIAITLLGLFAKLSRDLLHEQLEHFDLVIGEFVRGFQHDVLTTILIFITDLGDTSAYIIVVLVLLFILIRYLKQYIEATFLLIAVLGSWGLNELLKSIFQRARPEIVQLVEQDGYSFPSGHAMVAFAAYGMIAYLIWVTLRANQRPSWYVIVLAIFLIVLIGISRIYLGVHYPSDVLAGYSAGAVWLLTCIGGVRLTHFYRWKKGKYINAGRKVS